MATIKLKHEKSMHTVQVDTAGTIEALRAQLQQLTGVPPERQKLIIAGKELKTDADVQAIKNNAKALLMGSAESLPEPPKDRPKFIEDLAGDDAVVEVAPPGLKNLGNTCYMNSTLQCYKMIPEFRKKLEALPPAPVAASETGVMNTLKGLYGEMDRMKSGQPVTPHMFVMMARQLWPQFDQQEQGHYLQQDAEEFCTAMMTASDNAFKSSGGEGLGALFEGAHEEVMQCVEAPDEKPVINHPTFRILRCNMDSETSTLETGLKNAMHQSREKNSETLGRNAEYSVTSKLDRLPEFLWVNLVRFEWRKDIGAKTKKLRKVVFPFKLDLYTLCSDGLVERMKAPRESIKKQLDEELEQKRRDKTTKFTKDEAKDGNEEVEMADGEAEADPAAPLPLGNNSGYYELCGVVTHRGRSADGGHYIGWTKQTNGRWMCFDDHKAYEVSEDKIRELAGGGEADSAYLLLYRTRDEEGKLAGLMK